jgi:hypothetical protein
VDRTSWPYGAVKEFTQHFLGGIQSFALCQIPMFFRANNVKSGQLKRGFPFDHPPFEIQHPAVDNERTVAMRMNGATLFAVGIYPCLHTYKNNKAVFVNCIHNLAFDVC